MKLALLAHDVSTHAASMMADPRNASGPSALCACCSGPNSLAQDACGCHVRNVLPAVPQHAEEIPVLHLGLTLRTADSTRARSCASPVLLSVEREFCMFCTSNPTLVLQEMASRHRVRAPCLQIIKTATVPAAMTKRVNVKQFHDSKIQFPLTRRLARCGPLS